MSCWRPSTHHTVRHGGWVWSVCSLFAVVLGLSGMNVCAQAAAVSCSMLKVLPALTLKRHAMCCAALRCASLSHSAPPLRLLPPLPTTTPLFLSCPPPPTHTPGCHHAHCCAAHPLTQHTVPRCVNRPHGRGPHHTTAGTGRGDLLGAGVKVGLFVSVQLVARFNLEVLSCVLLAV